ncbi:secretin and TonB N-terminal domain-containing protein [Achromobacter xylosoxidans]
MPRHFHPTRTSTLLFCTLLGLAIPAAAQPLTDTLRLCIPSLPLGDALVELGRQSGLEISFPPDAVANKMSPVVRGRFPARLALDQMLEGSGLALRADGENRYIIYVDKPDPASTSRLEPVRVYGDQVGERLYDQEEIAATPSSNRDLSTLVANHPAVRTNPGAAGSRNRGSLDVEDISFHGASPYQNLFQIDGIDATNRVDPANKQLAQVGGNVPSNPQSYFIDTSLLQAVQVRDSFIPVEYGRFNGGVVDARLRRFSGENHLKFDYRWNTSSMTQQRVSPGQENKWAQGEPGFTPRWKTRYSAVADIAVNDKAGLVLAMSHRQSRIERWIMSVDDKGKPLRTPNIYGDRIDNFLGKFSVHASADTVADLTLKYSDRGETLASNMFRDTHWDNNPGAYGVSGNLEHRLGAGRLMLQAGWDHAMSNRRSMSREWVTTRPYGLPSYFKEASAANRSNRTPWCSRAVSISIRCTPKRSRTTCTRGSTCNRSTRPSSVRNCPRPTRAPTAARTPTSIPTCRCGGRATCAHAPARPPCTFPTASSGVAWRWMPGCVMTTRACSAATTWRRARAWTGTCSGRATPC